jgi:hypothetical protein
LKAPAGERLFALTTAAITLETEAGLRFGGVGAIVYKPLSSGSFDEVDTEMRQLLHEAAKDSGAEIERRSDTFGFMWLIVRDSELEDTVASVHVVASELQARGFGPQLLAAVFRFEGGTHPVYWIYGYKRGAFWPFVPTGEEQERDNAEELELKAKLEHELPIEADLSRWFGLFDAPF